MNDIKTDLVHLVRLAVSEQTDDVRLYAARLVRRYRNTDPEMAAALEECLKANHTRGNNILRRGSSAAVNTALPVDEDSRLSLLKVFRDDASMETPLFTQGIREALGQLIAERQHLRELRAKGLQPTRSAMFVGPPGVGKTITARWLAAQLGAPLYVLDLTAVMSSFLGRSGNNLRAALDFAKRESCVLLLDEIDAIAKRRSDESDVGELKRLVTVILQEVDQWPSAGLLLAATNHPELIDPALWRRFDLMVNFPAPDDDGVRKAIRRFLGADLCRFAIWEDVLAKAFAGVSFSDIERELNRFRRALVLGTAAPSELVAELLRQRMPEAGNPDRIDWAINLAHHNLFSQRATSELTGVSRDTIRKYTKVHKEPKPRVNRRKVGT